MPTLSRTKRAEFAGHALPMLFQSSYNGVHVLAGTTAETVAVPTGAKAVVIITSADCWIDFINTAAKPGAENIDGDAPIYIPAKFPRAIDLQGAAEFSIVSDGGALAHFEWSL